MTTFAAVDLGATSGRVVLGGFAGGALRLDEVARFRNGPVRTPDGLHWSVLELYRDVVEGLATAVRHAPDLTGIGIDSWAVDYALLRGGRMLSTPYSYRDERTAAGVDAVHAVVSADELYRRNGLQHLPFNTVFQLAADRMQGLLPLADGFLLIPDLLSSWLTGTSVAERTNASTTGLLGITTGAWDSELAERLDIPAGILPDLVDAGTALGGLLPSAARGVGATDAVVSTVGSHDTASAVVAVPATEPGFAYISSGTWSLVGVELERPVLSEQSRAANFTNEGGVDGRVRYLRNVGGLWLLSESIREWERVGESIDLAALLASAEAAPADVPLFDVDDALFLPPGDMPSRIRSWLAERGMPVPHDRPTLVRCILASLADAYARTIEQARQLIGADIRVLHIVGGGSNNTLLCRLTADATGLPVVAGPDEATAIGNVLVQARTHGVLSGSLESLRSVVRDSFPVRTFTPSR